jgi:hypothetical protein
MRRCRADTLRVALCACAGCVQYFRPSSSCLLGLPARAVASVQLLSSNCDMLSAWVGQLATVVLFKRAAQCCSCSLTAVLWLSRLSQLSHPLESATVADPLLPCAVRLSLQTLFHLLLGVDYWRALPLAMGYPVATGSQCMHWCCWDGAAVFVPGSADPKV